MSLKTSIRTNNDVSVRRLFALARLGLLAKKKKRKKKVEAPRHQNFDLFRRR
jgi:hypothetical protein